MTRMIRAADALQPLPDFAPVCVQTGDRCISRLAKGNALELHLWQSQPVDDALRARLPLERVLSMCCSPKYADTAVPDWCFDAWPEGGVPQGTFDAACIALALSAARPATDGRLSTCHAHAHVRASRLTASRPVPLQNKVDRPRGGWTCTAGRTKEPRKPGKRASNLRRRELITFQKAKRTSK